MGLNRVWGSVVLQVVAQHICPFCIPMLQKINDPKPFIQHAHPKPYNWPHHGHDIRRDVHASSYLDSVVLALYPHTQELIPDAPCMPLFLSP